MLNRPSGMPARVCSDAEVEPEEVQVGDGGDAVGPVGEVGPVVAVEVEHGQAEDLTEAERHDGEVVAGDAQRRGADDQAEGGRGGRARRASRRRTAGASRRWRTPSSTASRPRRRRCRGRRCSPRSSRPARPTTMFRPRAVAAKIRICVAIDMLASEPSWVNGKRNATRNAASSSGRRLFGRDEAEVAAEAGAEQAAHHADDGDQEGREDRRRPGCSACRRRRTAAPPSARR